MRKLSQAALLAILFAVAPAFPQDATPRVAVNATVTVGGEVAKPLVVDAELMRELERRTVTLDAHGSEATYEGVSLQAILERVGVPFGQALRGDKMALYILVDARDGYRVVFSITELAPVFGDAVVVLADRRNGQPLSAKEGPYRLIVPNDKRPARSVRQVTSLMLKSATEQ